MLRPFGTITSIAVVDAIKLYSKTIQVMGGTHSILQGLRNIVDKVLGNDRDTMRVIDLVLDMFMDVCPKTCTLVELSTTMFTLLLCQMRSEPYIKPNGRSYQRGEDTRIMQCFSRFSDYASAAYARPSANRPRFNFGSDRFLKPTMKDSIIQEKLGLHSKNIYPYISGPTIDGRNLLEHFVAVDDEHFRVVLSFKGTITMEDVLKDLDAAYLDEEIWGKTHQVHRGMWRAARDFINNSVALSQIRHELDAHPKYSLAIVGHSLGGGVAALVSILLSRPVSGNNFETNTHTLAGRDINCFTIGSGACVDADLGQRAKSMIYSLVNGYDVVPCISIGMIKGFCQMSRQLWDNSRQLRHIMRDVLTEKTRSDKLLKHLEYLKSKSISKRLVPAGRVWVIIYGDTGDVADVEEVINVQERFGYISLKHPLRLVSDHFLEKRGSISSKLEPFCS